MDLILTAVIVLSTPALGLPLFQLASKERRGISGYLLIVALATALSILVFNSVAPQPDPAFKNLLTSDSLGGFFAMVTLGATLMVAVVSTEYIRSPNSPVYYGLLSFTALGMVLLSYAQDLLMLFISWELMSLQTYASFLAEFMVISAGVSAYSVTAVSVLVPVITAGYFLWMIKRTVLSAPEGDHQFHDMSRADVASFAAYLIPLVLVIVFSYVILTPAAPVAQYLWSLVR